MLRRLAACAVRVVVAGGVGLLAAVPAAGAPVAGGKTGAPNPAAWSLQRVGLPQAWRLGRGDPSTVIAVLDSGVDPSDPNLLGALVPGHDFVQGGNDTRDDLGHGTLVAGVIAGRGLNGASPGACPRCLIMPVRVIDAAGNGYAAAIAAGIVWATDHGARVVNMSFVMPTTDAGIASAVSYALAHGVVLVAGAGNGGGDTSSVSGRVSRRRLRRGNGFRRRTRAVVRARIVGQRGCARVQLVGWRWTADRHRSAGHRARPPSSQASSGSRSPRPPEPSSATVVSALASTSVSHRLHGRLGAGGRCCARPVPRCLRASALGSGTKTSGGPLSRAPAVAARPFGLPLL